MTHPTLHYIHDPLCGWCYGAAPLVRAARDTVRVQLHGGGMMTGAARRPVTAELRQFVMGHDQRIAQVSGQPFGAAYFEGLLRDHGAVLDSEPPITATLAAEELAGAGLDMLASLQRAHYVDGQRIADPAVLTRLAVALGMEADTFDLAYQRLQGAPTQAHIDQSRALLARIGGRGFPALVLERDDVFTPLDIGSYLGRPEAWKAWLAQTLQGTHEAASATEPASCSIDGCTP